DYLLAVCAAAPPSAAQAERPYTPRLRSAGKRLRRMLVVPLLREGRAIGALNVSRFVVRPFTDAEIALLETFADQAVIAIENARLFEELERRNHELSEALEQQTATAEILRVIASSPTELQAVLDTLVETAARLTEADGAVL